MYKPPAAILPDGVDLAKFSPDNLQRFDTASERPLVLGWVGNSKWANHLGDPKGLHTILKPAIEELRSEGLNIEEFFADRQIRMIAHADMPAYYNKIDVLICTSEIEGTPNPVLEAMACGVPVITTDVGIVPQAFGELQKEFILPERNVATLKDAIRRLFKDPSLLQKLSAENLTSIAPWNWPIMAAQFGPFFHKALQPHSHANRRQG
jgi:glycosyltransferase involved in cell wall biosynthesis